MGFSINGCSYSGNRVFPLADLSGQDQNCLDSQGESSRVKLSSVVPKSPGSDCIVEHDFANDVAFVCAEKICDAKTKYNHFEIGEKNAASEKNYSQGAYFCSAVSASAG